jgi:DNA transposition AAA+ family ATPase
LPATRHEIEGSELLDRMRLVAEAFRPAAPIDRRNLFSGRTRQIGELFAVVAQPGQHAVVYGERGVGKTSLATVAADTLRSTNVLTTRATCDTSDDFSSVWRKGLDEIVLRTATPAVGFAPSTREAVESAAGLLKSPDVRPHDVRKALGAVGQQREIVVFVDEFDRLQDPAARTLFADTIKMLSDQLVRATVVLVGVADDVNELIREHGSVERALVQVHMPRMSRAELTEIVTKGMATAQMTIGKTAADRVALLSQGLPHYTHLLSQLAAQAALDANRTDVTVRDVEFPIERAIEKAQHTIMDAYARATETTRRSLLPRVLVACALAACDEFGFFGTADVRQPLSKILGRPCETQAFAGHLEELSSPSRGPVLQKRGEPRRFRYRFVNPLLQPYVVMRAVSDGVVRQRDLR